MFSVDPSSSYYAPLTPEYRSYSRRGSVMWEYIAKHDTPYITSLPHFPVCKHGHLKLNAPSWLGTVHFDIKWNSTFGFKTGGRLHFVETNPRFSKIIALFGLDRDLWLCRTVVSEPSQICYILVNCTGVALRRGGERSHYVTLHCVVLITICIIISMCSGIYRHGEIVSEARTIYCF